MRGWSIPRELLWALIGAQAIALIALWSTGYPYRQAPNIDTQQQAKDSIGSQHSADYAPAAPIGGASEQENQHGSEYAGELTVFGIKPGEWLLGIVTWMLWIATARLVTNADKNAEKQLRAYIHVGGFEWKAFRRIGAPWGPDTGWAIWLPFENFGATPARSVITHISWDTFLPFDGDVPPDFMFAPIGDPSPGPALIGPKGKINSDSLEIESNILSAVAARQIRLFVWGHVAYADAFEDTPERRTEFCFELQRVDGDPYELPEGQDSPRVFLVFRICGRYNRVDEDCAQTYS